MLNVSKELRGVAIQQNYHQTSQKKTVFEPCCLQITSRKPLADDGWLHHGITAANLNINTVWYPLNTQMIVWEHTSHRILHQHLIKQTVNFQHQCTALTPHYKNNKTELHAERLAPDLDRRKFKHQPLPVEVGYDHIQRPLEGQEVMEPSSKDIWTVAKSNDYLHKPRSQTRLNYKYPDHVQHHSTNKAPDTIQLQVLHRNSWPLNQSS
ncbi:hypothetical protein O181_100684 [Austropuccinia psidii MF-1]|uniref:Uncharacterized protein n=1 Tax=Austropuccinia psidii MF-1 TaxID=1389203 RepID=A0A9Q3JF31_9BASI|nr:hypothetical protein [Austropuccinia psidii MF-1]